MITIGFTLIGQGRWSGGENYLRNTLSVIRDQLSDQVRAKLLLSPRQAEQVGSGFDTLLSQPAIIDPRVEGAGSGRRGLAALVLGSDSAFADVVIENGIDVVFENAQWLGARFPRPVMSWIPDFQHALLPHLFPAASRWKREIGFRIQCASQRIIVLSSQDALRDCERLYPLSHGKTAVVRFTVDLDPERHIRRRAEVVQRYGLPHAYFFLPNQFWTHKNHLLVVEALNLLAKRLDPAALPTVVMTGRTQDPRDPGLFDRVMGQAAQAKLSDNFRHLGQVPVDDVYTLMAGATALINPSRFEGWSTPVEEAKALGTPMLLSNISVHREQAPSARFFSLTNPRELADLLVDDVVVNRSQDFDLGTLRSSTNARQHRHATELLRAIVTASEMGMRASKAARG